MRAITLLLCLCGCTALAQIPELDWAISIGGNSQDDLADMVVDDQGNVFVVGDFEGTADFDPGPGLFELTSTGLPNVFIAKYGPDGALIWARQLVGDSQVRASSINMDSLGNLIITGDFFWSRGFRSRCWHQYYFGSWKWIGWVSVKTGRRRRPHMGAYSGNFGFEHQHP